MDPERCERLKGTGGRLVGALLALLLTSCANMLAPAPDGVVWLRDCDVGKVTEEGLALITRGDEFCPSTIEVDAAGIIWGAGDAGELRLVAGDRWIRVAQDYPPEEPVVVIDLAVASDGKVWLVTGVGEGEELTARVHSFNGNLWLTYASADGIDFGTVRDRYEPADRILAALPRGQVALVTSGGLYLYAGVRWTRVLSGEFTTVSSTPNGDLWIAGPSGLYVWPAEGVPPSANP